MKIKFTARFIAARALGAVRIGVQVSHISHDVALGALRYGRTHVFRQAPVDELEVFRGIFVRGKTANQKNTRAFLQGNLALFGDTREAIQGKVFLGDIANVDTPGFD